LETCRLDASKVRGDTLSSVIAYRGKKPKLHETVFIAEGARIIGDVEIGKESSIWFNTVVRGDVHSIRIGERTNIQDNCVLHVTHETFALQIGSDVTVGHGAVLHGCTIHDCCLVGMGAIVLDNAKVKTRSFVAVGALVPENFEVPEGMLVAGVPARVKRPLTGDEVRMLEQSAQNYLTYVKTYRE
jgi:carbonic anhydrase/acetyltransferase-like protein (isoleucine patch superfamily)